MESSLRLLAELDRVDSATVRGFFVRNFFLDQTPLTQRACMELVSGGVVARLMKKGYFAQAEADYRAFERRKRLSERVPDEQIPRELRGELDGPSWA